MTEEQKRIPVNNSKIKMAIQTGIPLTITTYTLPHDIEVYMTDVLTAFLTELAQKQMVEFLTYCLIELVTNAKKANTKRVYFEEKHLDLTNEDDYVLGMKTFKEDTISRINYYLDLQKNKGLYVKLILQVRNNKIRLEVRNNAVLTFFEYKRIHDKISRAQQYTSVNEALTQIIDDTEGAGLGLIIMILMLKKIGLTEENYQVLTTDTETITRIILPLNEKTQSAIEFLSGEFAKIIDELPQFPKNIAAVNKLLDDPESKLSDIAMHISNDVSLTAELLRLVNSAAFAMSSSCKSIFDAVRLVGLRGIRNLLISIGSLDALAAQEDEVKEKIWSHAYQVAFYSYNLARNLCVGKKEIIEDAYVCGLLHDMGKIIFQTAHPGLMQNLKVKCAAAGISDSIFELLVAGVNHGEIGALIAEKWNFPEVIISVIRYHHDCEAAPQEYRTLTYLVCLADMMVHYGNLEIEYEQIDPNVLKHFQLTDKTKFEDVIMKLKQAFSNK
ncbi:MAG: HDOD domain-containing protein [Treponema sp.]|nr:HDOD domain-containing protein [Treponema sp.]